MEAALVDVIDDNNRGFMSVEDKSYLIELENKIAKILKEQEELGD